MSDELSQQFLEHAEEEGTLDEFCESVDHDTQECKMAVADAFGDNEQPERPNEQPEPEPDVQDEDLPGEQEEITGIVADCIGKSRLLGLSRPNEHACYRAFEKQQRKIEELERKMTDE